MLEQLDAVPTLYLLVLGYVMHLVGKSIGSQHPQVKAWQAVLALFVLTSLAIGRLFVDPPHDLFGIALVLIRVGGLALIIYGAVGVLVALCALIRDATSATARSFTAICKQIGTYLRRPQTKQFSESHSPIAPSPETAILTADETEQAELQLRREQLHLATKLEMLALTPEMREIVEELVEAAVAPHVPIEQTEQRLETIQTWVAANSVKRQSYPTVTALVSHFEERRLQLEAMDLEEGERASLQALLMMERQTAMQRMLQ